MASDTASNVIQGQCLKSHFVLIWVLSLLTSSFNFFKELHYLCKIIQQSHPTDLNQAKVLLTLIKGHFFERLSKLCINWANSQIGKKCDFRNWPHITFSDNVGMILFSFGISSKFFREEPPQAAHFKCLKNLCSTLYR